MRHLLLPDLFLPTTPHFTLALMEKHGIEAVLVDADNTLVARNQYGALDEDMEAWVEAVQGSGRKLFVLSNSNHPAKVAKMVEPWGIEAISNAGKPFKRGYLKALEATGSTPETTAMVGDQLFTDILGGNRMGMLTVMVQPLATQDFIFYRPMRYVERWVMRKYNRVLDVVDHAVGDAADLNPAQDLAGDDRAHDAERPSAAQAASVDEVADEAPRP